MMDDIDQATYNLVHQYPGGAPRLSKALYNRYELLIKPGTLMNKANPEQEHKLSIREAVAIQNLQEKYSLLHAEARAMNHVAVPLGRFASTSDTELLSTYTRLHKELGDMAAAIHNALADGRITLAEVLDIRRETYEAMGAMLEMERRLYAICDDLHSVDEFDPANFGQHCHG